MKAKRKLVATTTVAYVPVEIYRSEELLNNTHAGGTFINRDGKAIIDLEPNMSEAERYECLLHELIHACDDMWCLRLSEHKTRVLAASLCQALRGMTKVKGRSRRKG